MLNRICWLHRQLKPEQGIRIIIDGDLKLTIDKTDILRKDDDCITVLRANGRIIVINPHQIKWITTTNIGGVV